MSIYQSMSVVSFLLTLMKVLHMKVWNCHLPHSLILHCCHYLHYSHG